MKKHTVSLLLNPSSPGPEYPVILRTYAQCLGGRFVFSTGEWVIKGKKAQPGKRVWNDGVIIGNSEEDIKFTQRLTKLKNELVDCINAGMNKEQTKKELLKLKDPNSITPEQEETKPNQFKNIVDFSMNYLGLVTSLIPFNTITGRYIKIVPKEKPDHIIYKESIIIPKDWKAPTYVEKSTKEKKPLTPGTVKAKLQSITVLKEFQKKYNRIVTFENCNEDFWDDFTDYLSECYLLPGSRGRIVKDIKSFLIRAFKKGYSVNQDYKVKDCAPVTKSEKKESIYLKREEIDKLASLNLSPALSNSRDWLLLACSLGQRVSDLMKLNLKDNLIDEDGYKAINIPDTQKTGALVEIPLNLFPYPDQVFARHNGNFPKRITVQGLDHNLKLIGELSGLNRKVPKTFRNRNMMVTKNVPISQCLSSHIGRRSFITNLIKEGYTLTEVAKMSGHADLETLKIYEQLSPSDSSRSIYKRKERELQIAK